MALPIFIGDDTDVIVPVVRAFTGASINDATVSAQLKEKDGTDVGSAVSCSLVADGMYLGLLPYTVSAGLTEGVGYNVWITVSGTANSVRRIPYVARQRNRD